MGARQPVLEVHRLNASFSSPDGPVYALKDVSLTLDRGEILGVVGESGSGKSTLLAAILRMLPAKTEWSAAKLEVAGVDVLALSAKEMRELRGTKISLIPQRPLGSLSPLASIEKQIRWHLREVPSKGLADRLHHDDPREAVTSLLKLVGLDAVAERPGAYPYELSGGQLQRILTAVAVIAHGPEVLLADEPTTTLDATVQAQVMRLILSMRERLGLSVLLVTHDLGIVAQACDRVIVMYAGEVVETGDVNSLFTNPRHPYTKALLDALPSRHPRGELPTPIPGSAMNANRLPGCPFHTRCTSVMDRCRVERPAAIDIDRSLVRCHLFTDGAS